MKYSSTVLSSALLFSFAGAVGCSPASEPIGKGAAHYQIAFPTDPAIDASCGVTSVGGIGSPSPPSLPSGNLPVSNFGQDVRDGQAIGDSGAYVVDCTVKKSGKIDLIMQGLNTSPSAASGSGETELEVHGSFEDDGTGTASVMVRTTESGATTSKPGFPCTLQASLDDEGKPIVGAGHAKFTFSCPQAVSPLADFDICETRGTVSVHDCLEK